MCSRAGPEVGEAAVTGDRRARDRTMDESGIWNLESGIRRCGSARKRSDGNVEKKAQQLPWPAVPWSSLAWGVPG